MKNSGTVGKKAGVGEMEKGHFSSAYSHPISGSTRSTQTAWRKGEYFWSPVASNNTVTAQWEKITVSSGGTTNTGNLFVPKTQETFQYDADGNLTNDGHWAYTWDAENRLISLTNNSGVGPALKLNFAYDPKGRRIQKLVVSNGLALYTNRFLYDGWNLVSVLSPNSSLLSSFVWGSDLSGSLQGAGGVGGLLSSVLYSNSYLLATHFYAYDGNGNVAALVSASDGSVAGNYEYGPFGEVLRATYANPLVPQSFSGGGFRFSTKYQDDESDLVYYGYRYYKASMGTWLSRDPI